MEKEKYVIEREYLGRISVKECMGMIIKRHYDTSREGKQPNYEKPLKRQNEI